jgi:basic amino acid/polyamine antiporter, APA family
MTNTRSTLLRTMGLFTLVVYGVGDMVGAGIYGTVGDAAVQIGNAVWLSFVFSMVAAVLTGLSYACLASRHPRAGGAAYVTQRAFHVGFISYLIGLMVTASGLTSMATSTNVFTRTVLGLTTSQPDAAMHGWPWYLVALSFLAFLTLVNLWGIRQSMWVNILCTFVEVGGLLFIVAIGARHWGGVDYLETPPAAGGLGLGMLLGSSVLTFFSFIGFEDMLNVSEEVKDPRRTMPLGIVLAQLVATILYIGVAVTVVSVIPYQEFAQRDLSPLARVTQAAAPWLPPRTFDFVTMFAVSNTVLINYIMGSRLLYGMARQGLLPAPLGRVHPTKRTPQVAILTLLAVVVVLAMSGGPDAVRQLADATALLLLCSFIVVNISLIVLKRRPGEPAGGFEVPVVVPALGVLVNAAMIVARITSATAGGRALAIAGGIIGGIVILYYIGRARSVTETSLAAAEAVEEEAA